MKWNTINKEKIIIIVLFIVLILIGMFFCIQKEGMHEDEVVTYGLANSEYGAWIYNVKGLSTPDMSDQVLTGTEINTYLTGNSNHRPNLSTAYNNQKSDVHPPLYYILLNITSSIGSQSFSNWSGLTLNIIIWALTLLLIFFGVRQLTDSNILPSIAMALYALSSGALSTLVFIRMYVLLTFFSTLLLYLMIRHYKENIKGIYVYVALNVLGGMLTHYEFLYYGFLLCLVYCVGLLMDNKGRKALAFGTSAMFGVIAFLVAFPSFFSQIRNGANSGSVSGAALIGNLLSVNTWIPKYANSYYAILTMGTGILVGLLILLVVYIIGLLITRLDFGKKIIDHTKIIVILIIIFVLNVLAMSILNPGIYGRYYYHLLPLLAILTGLLLSSIGKTWEFLAVDSGNKKLVGRRIALVIFCSILVIISFSNIEPDYLYKGYRSVNVIAETLKSVPTVYISSEAYDGVHDETLQFLRYSDDCYIQNINDIGSKKVLDYVNNHADNSEVLLYVDTLNQNTEEIAMSTAVNLGYNNVSMIFGLPRTNVYLLSM